MMKFKMFNISYDVDEVGDDDGLPKEIIGEFDDEMDVMMRGADYISDTTGFCVCGFLYEPVVI